MPPEIDIAGCTFGRWLVIEKAPKKHDEVRRWICRCLCGTHAEVISQTLRDGRSTSCGCLHRELTSVRSRTHGQSRTLEYRKWKAAKSRCYNPKTPNFADYGGRGIVMADEWRHDFPRFLHDMGPCPDGYELDRIDNDGPYAPGNCRWTTNAMQALNRRNTLLVTINGQSMPLMHAIQRFGSVVGYDTAHDRVTRLGWTAHDALQTPPDANGNRHR